MDIITRDKVKEIKDLNQSEVLLTYNMEEQAYQYARYVKKWKAVENKGLYIEFEDGRSGSNKSSVYLPAMAELLKSDNGLTVTRAKDLKVGDTVLKYKINNSVSDFEYVKIKAIEQGKELRTYYKLDLDKFVVIDKVIVRI